MYFSSWPSVASFKHVVKRGEGVGLLSPCCLSKFFQQELLGFLEFLWKWAQVPGFPAVLTTSGGDFLEASLSPACATWDPSHHLEAIGWPFLLAGADGLVPRLGKGGLNSPWSSGWLCVELGSMFCWSLICPCCSGLQGMEDHFLVYTFITRLQGGKRTTDWRAPGQTHLLSGSLSRESRNVQGDFLPFVHTAIWQGASDQGWDKKMRLKSDACFWLFPNISLGDGGRQGSSMDTPVRKLPCLSRTGPDGRALWESGGGWLYLLFPSGTVQKFWCCWWQLRSEVQNPS